MFYYVKISIRFVAFVGLLILFALFLKVPSASALITSIDQVTSSGCVSSGHYDPATNTFYVIDRDRYDALCTNPDERAFFESIKVPPPADVQKMQEEEDKLRAERALETSCTWYRPDICIEELWNQFITLIGFLFAGLGAFLLIITGSLFDFFLTHTIAQFGMLIDGTAREVINTVWSAFRDVANIVIIGMFTFIAISLILGIKEYGERKMIARVLIVAVLINFSLLFTKIIIDASNFTAVQFYRAAELQTGDAGTGIAGAFLQSMGATTVGELYGVLYNQQTSAGGEFWKTILFGFLTGILFLAAAVVLLYGSFLLLARALLLIFLMIMSPLAFASWLIPKFAQEGWHKWWDTLLKNAVFAPLLMILIWASLLITSKFEKGGGTLGSLVADPSNAKGIEAIFYYLVILGMLFLSIKLASKFSGTISGFSVAMTGAVAPFTLGSLALGRVMGSRFGLGRLAQNRTLGLDEKIKDQRNQLSAISYKDSPKEWWKKQRDIEKLERKKGRAEGWAKSDFNVFQTSPAKAAMAGLGVKGVFSGAREKALGGYATGAKARAEAAGKTAQDAALSSNDIKNMVGKKEEELTKMRQNQKESAKETRRQLAEQIQVSKEGIETEKQKAKTAHDEIHRGAGGAITNAENAKKDAARNKERIQQEADAAIKRLAEEIERAPEGAKDGLRSQMNNRLRKRDADLDAQEIRITNADKEIKEVDALLEKRYKDLESAAVLPDGKETLAAAEKRLSVIDEELQNYDSETAKVVGERLKGFEKQVKEGNVKSVEALAAHLSGPKWLPTRMRGAVADPTVAQMARSDGKKRLGRAGLTDLAKAISEGGGEASASGEAPKK